MRGYPQFSFWISIAVAKICFSRIVIVRKGSRDGAIARALASHECGFERHMSFEFVVGSRPFPERFFFQVLRFSSLHKKKNISKFHFNLERTVTFERVSKELFDALWVNK